MLFLLLGLFVAGLLVWRPFLGPIRNYNDAEGPLFLGNHASDVPEFRSQIKVVSWNMGYAEQIETAVNEFQNTPELQQTDILLLQEMTEQATEFVAKTMGLNYVYYPASVHKHHQQNFGNALLSRWPITAYRKLLLPETMSRRQHTRLAAVAQITIGEIEIAVYSVHTGHIWMLSRPGMREIDTLAKDIATGSQFVIVGGDFNTHMPGSKTSLKTALTGAALTCVSLPTGPTFKTGPLQMKLDHLFTRGMSIQKAGICTDTSASDHFPIWADLKLEAN